MRLFSFIMFSSSYVQVRVIYEVLDLVTSLLQVSFWKKLVIKFLLKLTEKTVYLTFSSKFCNYFSKLISNIFIVQ